MKKRTHYPQTKYEHERYVLQYQRTPSAAILELWDTFECDTDKERAMNPAVIHAIMSDDVLRKQCILRSVSMYRNWIITQGYPIYIEEVETTIDALCGVAQADDTVLLVEGRENIPIADLNHYMRQL